MVSALPIIVALLGSIGGAQQDPLERLAQHVSEVKARPDEKPRRGINFSFEQLRLLERPLCLHLHWGFDRPDVGLASDVLEDKYVLQEADGSQASHPATRRYHYAAQPLAVTTGTVTSYLNVDALGSVTDATSTTGAITTARQYDAWGQYRNNTAPTPSEPKLGFTGHQFDVETGLVYARARYYDPALGNFLSRDSVEGNLNDAPSLHRYAYAHNNPVRYTDPDGLCVKGSEGCNLGFFGIFKAAYAGVATDESYADAKARIEEANFQEYQVEVQRREEHGPTKVQAATEFVEQEVVAPSVKVVVESRPGRAVSEAREATGELAGNLSRESLTGLNPYREGTEHYAESQQKAQVIGKDLGTAGGKVVFDAAATTGVGQAVAPVLGVSARGLRTAAKLAEKEEAALLKGVVRKEAGVTFRKSPHLYPVTGDQRNIVKIQYTGSRRQDFAAANAKGGIGTTQKPPDGYTWHHLDDYDPATNSGTMQLVKREAHEATYPHAGGVSQYEQATKSKYK